MGKNQKEALKALYQGVLVHKRRNFWGPLVDRDLVVVTHKENGRIDTIELTESGKDVAYNLVRKEVEEGFEKVLQNVKNEDNTLTIGDRANVTV